MGRPKKGSLSTFQERISATIKQLRESNEGWGAKTLLVELEEEKGFSASELPSVRSVNRYLKQSGLVKAYERHGTLGVSPCKMPEEVHELWEMDAQGPVEISGIGLFATINVKDIKSRKHCISFPLPVKHKRCQPIRAHYMWALRLAFSESGLPSRIKVDHDSVYIENTTKSPFPTMFHFWLTALGIDLCFTPVHQPKKQAVIERTHQTMERQAMQGQYFEDWRSLFERCEDRRKRLNEKMPSSSLGNKAPLQAFPQALHSGRQYSIEMEPQLLDLNRIYALLAKGQWFRLVSSAKTISLGKNIYYLKKAVPKTQLRITFSEQEQQFVFRDVNELIIDQLPIKGIDIQDLIGIDINQLILIKNRIESNRNFPIEISTT